MRVLQVIGAMDRGGAETVIMNLYRVMDREKVQFDFLVHEERECDYDAEIQAMGGRIFRLPRYTIANGHQYRRLCRKHFEEHPEHLVVHGHIGSSAGIYLSEAKRAGRATVLHSHAQNYDGFPMQQIFNMLVKPSLKVSDYFLACSPEAGMDRFGAKIMAGESCRVMANGVDTRIYACDAEGHDRAKEDLGLSGKVVVGHVGRFIEVKNHRFLFGMFKLLREQVPEAKLLLLGRGPLEGEMKEYAASLGIAQDVVFCGVRDDVPRYLKAFDLFVFPSVLEGLPMATVEAQAAGIPAILSTGVPESAVASRFTKRLDLGDGEQAWADCAAQMIATQHDRSKGAADVLAAGYDIRDTAQWLARLYGNLAASSGGCPIQL